jgi:hypothetical protein
MVLAQTDGSANIAQAPIPVLKKCRRPAPSFDNG